MPAAPMRARPLELLYALVGSLAGSLVLVACAARRPADPPAPPPPPRALDQDRDGVVDADDLCVAEAEDLDGHEDLDGCPDPDNDMDGVADENDLCPCDPEDFDGFEDGDGCPDNDNDGDGIADLCDACPDLAETFNGYEDEDGCPDSGIVTISGAETETEAEGVHFARNSATITPHYARLLAESAEVLIRRPSITRIDVYGCAADDEGRRERLSLARAEAVRDALVALGVERRRMSVHGRSDAGSSGCDGAWVKLYIETFEDLSRPAEAPVPDVAPECQPQPAVKTCSGV